jgi:hypothetical protein
MEDLLMRSANRALSQSGVGIGKLWSDARAARAADLMMDEETSVEQRPYATTKLKPGLY